MAELILKREKDPIWFDDEKFDDVNEVLKNWMNSKEDTLIELPNQTIRASEVLKIKRQGMAGGKEVLGVTQEEFDTFSSKIEAYKIEDKLPHYQRFNFLMDMGCAVIRDPQNEYEKVLKLKSNKQFEMLTLSVVEDAEQFFTFYNKMFDKWDEVYGKKEFISKKFEELKKGRGVVSEALKEI